MSSISFTERFFSSTRGRIVSLLRRKEATVEELASEVGVTDNAVRSQLAALERDGLVRRGGSRPGVAKPSYLYRIAADVEPMLSRLYAPMFVELMRELSGRMPSAELSAVMHAVGRRLAATVPPPHGDLRSRVAAASALLNALGGVTEVEARGPALVIRGYACPLGAAATDHREVCEAVEMLLAALLDTPVREQCDRSDRARCCFEVSLPGD
ncbi:MAG: ArsR family transcriptional regulator [Gemmatimonadota bacterium]